MEEGVCEQQQKDVPNRHPSYTAANPFIDIYDTLIAIHITLREMQENIDGQRAKRQQLVEHAATIANRFSLYITVFLVLLGNTYFFASSK